MSENKDGDVFPLVAVAIDRNKTSQMALKWALDNLLSRGQTVTLIHVINKANNPDGQQDEDAEANAKEMLIPFRCFCTRKDVYCKDVILEDTDVASAIIEFVSHASIEKLVLGSASKGGFARRFKTVDVPSNISKGVPDFCNVYVISKGKLSSVRNAIRAAPATSAFRTQIQNQPSLHQQSIIVPKGDAVTKWRCMSNDMESIRSPFSRGINSTNMRSYKEPPFSDTDISFISSSTGSSERNFPARLSNGSEYDRTFESVQTPQSLLDAFGDDVSMPSYESSSSEAVDDVEAEMKRLRLELKHTMDMYSSACREALTAKQKAMELHRWKIEEVKRFEEARLAEEAALSLAETERAKCKAAMEAAEAAQRIADREAQKRIDAETKALREAEERNKAIGALSYTDLRYRRYTIEEIEAATDQFADHRKIGEGGYGPVYKCILDHTQVAVKVLRSDADQFRSQFHQEVEILSCIRHPNMVLLLGACPENGCLVYEYMGNESLEDRLFRKGNTPPLPWQYRFRIAAEIGTGLLFLHQTKPEPLVHRDLKPANILLDLNYVSKISDVGLARLVPPSVADDVTQCLMTSTAGTFCYIDPEYQQTGMLGVKSDVYSLGIILLQILTGKSAMGLTHHVDRAIEKGTFRKVLDPTVPDWPVEDALRLAEIALKCAELRRKDRPDLDTVVLPELQRLRALAEQNMQQLFIGSAYNPLLHGHIPTEDATRDLQHQNPNTKAQETDQASQPCTELD